MRLRIGISAYAGRSERARDTLQLSPSSERERNATKSMADPSYDLGNYSFLAGPDGAGAATASTAAPPDGVDYEKGATPLYRAIEARDWSAAVSRVRHHPSEAKMWVYRLRPDGVTVRWRVLPLHQVSLLSR